MNYLNSDELREKCEILTDIANQGNWRDIEQWRTSLEEKDKTCDTYDSIVNLFNLFMHSPTAVCYYHSGNEIKRHILAAESHGFEDRNALIEFLDTLDFDKTFLFSFKKRVIRDDVSSHVKEIYQLRIAKTDFDVL